MKYIFGPVPSRRLGSSLGIDIIPFKTCTLNCIYCECGNTTNLTLERKVYVKTEEIINELKEFLSKKIQIDYITFSGSGEPTLNSEIGNMIQEIKKLTTIPVVVLTNGTLLYREDVRNELLLADLVIPSLDAVTEEVFLKINRPCKGLTIKKIIDGMIKFSEEFKGRIWLEIFFVKDVNDNMNEINQMIKVIKKISPEKVQLNTIDRPPAEIWASSLNIKELELIKNKFGDAGIYTEIITRIDSGYKISKKEIEQLENRVFEILKRRPETAEGLSTALKVHINHINKILRRMEENSIIFQNKIGNRIFYTIKK